MKKVIVAILSAIMLFATTPVSYGENSDWHGGIRSRIYEEQQRIDRGFDRGSLTRREARRLQRELGDILERIDRMRSDGRLDRRERDRIHRDLNRLSRQITVEKRDSQRRGY
jgi:hypothetical protein